MDESMDDLLKKRKYLFTEPSDDSLSDLSMSCTVRQSFRNKDGSENYRCC